MRYSCVKLHVWQLTEHMWPDVWKPDIMVHTKIFSIKYYKTWYKNAFHKNSQWLYKGNNLAMLTLIGKPKHHCAPYHVRSTEIFVSCSCILIYSYTTSACSWVVKNNDYLSVLIHLIVFSVVSLYSLKKLYIIRTVISCWDEWSLSQLHILTYP